MTEKVAPQPATFVRGNDHLDRLLSDPHVAAANAAAEEMDRVHPMNILKEQHRGFTDATCRWRSSSPSRSSAARARWSR